MTADACDWFHVSAILAAVSALPKQILLDSLQTNPEKKQKNTVFLRVLERCLAVPKLVNSRFESAADSDELPPALFAAVSGQQPARLPVTSESAFCRFCSRVSFFGQHDVHISLL